jgi:phosphomannomutase
MEYSENFPRLLIDGVKIFMDDDWALLIPDKERPIFHIIVETGNHEESAALAREYETLVREWKEETGGRRQAVGATVAAEE